MPQGRRKVPFSKKQKKVQLQAKREKKNRQLSSSQLRQRRPFVSDDGDIEDELDDELTNESHPVESTADIQTFSNDLNQMIHKIQSLNSQRHLDADRDINRYALRFFAETDQEIRERKEKAQKPLRILDSKNGLVCSAEDLFGKSSQSLNDIPFSELDMPKRPPWSPSMTKEELDREENHYFHEYCKNLLSKAIEEKRLSYFELNLETWRQLWRVIEMSDIILLVTDIRNPIFHFPPSLYHHVVNELGKEMILVLNKIDLVEVDLVIAWEEYLKKLFPRLNILAFASYAGMKVRSSSGKRVGKLRMAIKGALALQEMVSKIINGRVNLDSWKQKIETDNKEYGNISLEDDSSYYESEDENDDANKRFYKKNENSKAVSEKPTSNVDRTDNSFNEKTDNHKSDLVTIGCVGHPNVGKSSLLNALYGRKVVSVSRTPGHTKHFQTIFLTENVRLCDCPGLVFPSKAPKELQVLMGCYPISQLREPYTTIGYLAQRIDLVRLLRLQHPEGDTENIWSAYDICEAWADKRGFITSKTARPDIYRSANSLLRMALDGRTICLAFKPPNYYEKDQIYWSNHPERSKIESIQNIKFVEEKFNKNLIRSTHGQGYVDSHASSVEADLDDDDDSGDVITSTNKFVLLEISDAEHG